MDSARARAGVNRGGFLEKAVSFRVKRAGLRQESIVTSRS